MTAREQYALRQHWAAEENYVGTAAGDDGACDPATEDCSGETSAGKPDKADTADLPRSDAKNHEPSKGSNSEGFFDQRAPSVDYSGGASSGGSSGGGAASGSTGYANPDIVPGSGIPLVQDANGNWTSPDPAWAHLINRESGGVNQVQKIHDVNSGGNEAEGLFQITPQTWAGAGGTQYAPSAISATPQQQADIAAEIFRNNPSGSDWGAGLSGREDPAALAQGLAPPPTQQPPGR